MGIWSLSVYEIVVDKTQIVAELGDGEFRGQNGVVLEPVGDEFGHSDI